MEAPTGTVQKYERDDIRGCDRIRMLMVRENSGSEFISDIRNGLAHCKDADLVAFNKKWLKTSRSSSQAFMLMFIEIMQEFRMLDPQLFVSPPCFRIAVSTPCLCSCLHPCLYPCLYLCPYCFYCYSSLFSNRFCSFFWVSLLLHTSLVPA